MPDISMCVNQKCPSKEVCYRYKARPNEPYQAYSVFMHGKSGKCRDFIEVRSKSQFHRLDIQIK